MSVLEAPSEFLVSADRESVPDAKRKARDLRRMRGQGRNRVPAKPVIDHLRELGDLGISANQIAAHTGIPRQTVDRLICGDWPTVGARIARTLISLDAGTLRHGLGARRRVQALIRAGWPIARLAREFGVERKNLQRFLAGVNPSTATVDLVYDTFSRLWDRDPVLCGVSPSAAAKAEALGVEREYLPALAWDNMDDPQESPESCDWVQSTAEERLDDMVWLLEQGVALEPAYQRNGWSNLNSVQRAASRKKRGPIAYRLHTVALLEHAVAASVGDSW